MKKIKLTAARKSRIEADLAHTRRMLRHEYGFSADLQNLETVERYLAHIAKLKRLLRQESMIVGG